ncbi:hypothetical protein NDU88_004340, partial [Pleurodeles waltl]
VCLVWLASRSPPSRGAGVGQPRVGGAQPSFPISFYKDGVKVWGPGPFCFCERNVT